MQDKDRITNHQNYLIRALNCIGDGVIITDLGGCIIYINAAAENLTQWSAREAYGKPIDHILSLVNQLTLQMIYNPIHEVIQHLEKVGLQNHTAAITKNGQIYVLSASYSPMRDEEHRVIGVIVVFRDITRIKSLEDEITDERNKLMLTFEALPVGIIIVDDERKIRQTNKVLKKMLHLKEDDIIGKRFGDGLFCKNSLERGCGFGSGCSLCEIWASLKLVMSTDSPCKGVILQHSFYINGKFFAPWLKVNFLPIVINGIKHAILVMDDITEIIQQEKELRDNDEKYRQLFNNATDLIFLHRYHETTNSSNIIDVNEAACRALGYTKEELIKLSLYDIRSEEMKKRLEETYDQLLTRGHYVYDSVHIAKDGRRVPLEVSSQLFEMNGSKVILSVCRDITERLNAERIIRESQKRLVRAKEAAEAANIAKSKFLANMSHEIRTPINGITGMIDLTLMTKLSEEQCNNLITAKNCADSLLNIINDVLDFSKMEAGKFTINPSTFDFYSLLDEIIKIHKVRAKEKKIDLVSDIPGELPKFLYGDPNRLRQVLNNLIHNATKFTEEGRVSLQVSPQSEEGEEIWLEFSIRDTGIGISSENRDKLFKSFSQIDASYTRKHGGTGLGLIISKQLVEMMDGRIWVESELGLGSTFSFCLPFKMGMDPKEKALVQCRTKPMNSLCILIAEDEPVNRKVLARMLENTGHQVMVASNGLEALELYQDNRLDVILMDIQMPVMDGIEAVRRIRELESSFLNGNNSPHIPIIAVTAFSLMGDRERFMNCGIDEYISKPIHGEKLLKLINDVLNGTPSPEDFNEIPIVNGMGEVEFVRGSNVRPSKERMVIINKADKLLNELVIMIMNDNYIKIEETIHSIKELFGALEAQELKDAAFKIELSVRKGKYESLWEDANYLIIQFEELKKGTQVREG